MKAVGTDDWTESARVSAGEAARHFRLPFRNRIWRGAAGNWAGAGVGSSIDFQDHRPYVAGDDPRYINWQAFARTGAYTMKLYREEVSPQVDLVLDTSPSMFHRPAKRARSWELFHFCLESALRSQAALRAWFVTGDQCREARLEAIEQGIPELPEFSAHDAPDLSLHGVPWRRNALRVFVSDLLDPRGGERVFPSLSSENSTSLLLAPYCREEENPAWNGNVELIDCETGERRIQFFSANLLERYRRDYQRHFELAEENARRHRVLFVRIPSEDNLLEALRKQALSVGAVEPWD